MVSDLCLPHCHESVITPSRNTPILKVRPGVDLEMFSLCPTDLPGFLWPTAAYLGHVVIEKPCGRYVNIKPICKTVLSVHCSW